jgi:hypothetical protein
LYCGLFAQPVFIGEIKTFYLRLFGQNTHTLCNDQGLPVNIKFAALAPVLLALTACVSTDTTTTTATPQQVGMAAMKIAINSKCIAELNNTPAWNTATKLMTAEQKQSIQTDICGCVSEKAPQNVTTVDLATAAIDPTARATIVTNVVTKTIQSCVAEAVNK